jgi:hypothetical protein
VLIGLVAFCVVTGSAAPGRADELYRAAEKLTADYAAKLEGLAAWCDEHGLAAQAQKTRFWLRPPGPDKLFVAVLPERVGRPDLPSDTPAEVIEWDARLARLRREQADRLFSLARRAVRGHRASLAIDLVLAAIRQNPDHEGLRRVLGYQKYHGGWHTTYEVRKFRAGCVWSDRFGWLRKADLRRYENGERLDQGRWITAEEDARRHDDIHHGWDIETEHYTIRTNHSIEAGVQLGVKLEQLYCVWKQLFIRYHATEQQVITLFDGRNRARRARLPRLSVVYFRDREDYNRSLRDAYPNIEMSTGVYVGRIRRAYFFAGKDRDDRTLYHEATHQLFHESRPVAADTGREANFWIVEGIAVYMETLRKQGDWYVLGGWNDQRMVAARYRLLHDGFYVPLDELTTYGMERLQTDPRVATLYSQMAGLTHFLIYYDHGRYRDALVSYLRAVYNGSQDPTILARLTGTPYGELDKQYRAFIKGSGNQLKIRPLIPTAR